MGFSNLRRWRGALLYMFSCVLFACVYPQVFASDTVKRADIPSWVDQQNFSSELLDSLPKSGPAYLLVSNQRLHEDADEHYYNRYVTAVTDISAAEDAAQISVSYDPSYETLAFHHVRLVRDGVVEDRYAPDEIKIYQNESEADRLIYNGRLTASMILSDVRPGDIVDYAYTISGKNPVFAGHIDDTVQLQYSVPVGRVYASISVPDDRSFQQKAYASAPEPEVRIIGTTRKFVWDRVLPSKGIADDDEPNWFRRYQTYQISDLADWSALGNLYSVHYQVPQNISPDLKAEIDEIRASGLTKAEHLRAALAFVQKSVRYLGIENGVGGYVPRDPSQVFNQRFGDCKDKSLLLSTVLSHLDIPSKPLLVDIDNRARFVDALPTRGSFDHVITLAELDGQTYWLDPTQNDQTGDLANMQQAQFGRGLTIDGASSQVLEQGNLFAQDRFEADVVETFDLVSEEDTVTLSIKATYWGGRADSLVSWLKSDGLEEIQQEYLKFYQSNYPTIEATGMVEISEDRQAGLVHVSENYRIPNAWTLTENKKRKTFSAWPFEVRSAMPDTDTVKRSSPLAISMPSNVRHELAFKVEDDWTFDLENTEVDLPAFSYVKTTSLSEKLYREIYEYRGLKDHVALDEMADFNSKMETVWDEAGIKLFKAAVNDAGEGQTSNDEVASDDLWESLAPAMILIILLMVFAVCFVKAIRIDRFWRLEAVFYPVSSSKFWIMSLGTTGMYLFFWTYKNWQWIRDANEEKLNPFWRSIFSIFTNFSLFERMVNREPQSGKWLRNMVIPLALLILITEVISQYLSQLDDDLTIWDFSGLLTATLVYPFARRVLSLNAGAEDLVARNSRYTWHSYVALGFGLILYGLLGVDMS